MPPATQLDYQKQSPISSTCRKVHFYTSIHEDLSVLVYMIYRFYLVHQAYRSSIRWDLLM